MKDPEKMKKLQADVDSLMKELIIIIITIIIIIITVINYYCR